MVYGTLKFYPVCSGGILLGDKHNHSPSGTYVKNAGSFASTSTRLYGKMYRKTLGSCYERKCTAVLPTLYSVTNRVYLIYVLPKVESVGNWVTWSDANSRRTVEFDMLMNCWSTNIRTPVMVARSKYFRTGVTEIDIDWSRFGTVVSVYVSVLL